jgi:hypothetical protein
VAVGGRALLRERDLVITHPEPIDDPGSFEDVQLDRPPRRA